MTPFCRMTWSPSRQLLADDGVGVSEEVAADVGVGIDHDVGQKRGMHRR